MMVYFLSSSDLNSKLHTTNFVNLFLRRPYALGAPLHQVLRFCLFEGILLRFHGAENYFCSRTCAVENCANDQNINEATGLY